MNEQYPQRPDEKLQGDYLDQPVVMTRRQLINRAGWAAVGIVAGIRGYDALAAFFSTPTSKRSPAVARPTLETAPILDARMDTFCIESAGHAVQTAKVYPTNTVIETTPAPPYQEDGITIIGIASVAETVKRSAMTTAGGIAGEYELKVTGSQADETGNVNLDSLMGLSVQTSIDFPTGGTVTKLQTYGASFDRSTRGEWSARIQSREFDNEPMTVQTYDAQALASMPQDQFERLTAPAKKLIEDAGLPEAAPIVVDLPGSRENPTLYELLSSA